MYFRPEVRVETAGDGHCRSALPRYGLIATIIMLLPALRGHINFSGQILTGESGSRAEVDFDDQRPEGGTC